MIWRETFKTNRSLKTLGCISHHPIAEICSRCDLKGRPEFVFLSILDYSYVKIFEKDCFDNINNPSLFETHEEAILFVENKISENVIK